MALQTPDECVSETSCKTVGEPAQSHDDFRAQTRAVRVWQLLLTVCITLCISSIATPATAFAYYNRGTVTIAPGTAYVSLTAGQSTSVSVYLDPAADSQLPGCGMQECPQECPPECFDANGQCICGGTTYSTYYPSVTCS